MTTLIFDIEANGLLDDVTTIHSLVIRDADTGEVGSFADQPGYAPIHEGILWLRSADCIVGHNIIGYDIPALQKVTGIDLSDILMFDTLVAARLIYSDIREFDFKRKFPELPTKLWGSQKLEAWGFRLGNYKGDFHGPWEEWSKQMQEYCEQDVRVTYDLYRKLLSKNYSDMALDLEHNITRICARMERHGFVFDEPRAVDLYVRLSKRRNELEQKLKETFGSWQVRQPDFIPKRDNKARGYKAGVPVERWKTIEFNPNSRDHIANRLIELYGWKPTEFTEGGQPKVDEDILKDLPYPTAPLLVEYLTVQKRIGQLAEGEQAWLKKIKYETINGQRLAFIRGGYNPNGAVTGRATHNNPNIGQVPANRAAYGAECRALFGPPPGWVQVGADCSGLELRCLAHFMARWDGGKYAEVVVNGDVHTENQTAAGLPTRDTAKTFIYAFLYGAGDEKIGSIVGKGSKEGKKLKAKFLKGLPALQFLREAVQAAAAQRKYLKGLDGRLVFVRSAHAALNTLLQSAGALICKMWLVILDRMLAKRGLKHGWDGDYVFMGWIHDEVQVACRNREVAEIVAQEAVAATAAVGQFFNFRCPLTGEAKLGSNWAECH